MRRIRFIRYRTIREERGSMSLAMAGLIFVGVVAILPLVFNLGTIWSIRRQSQNSSDAASLAAAESIARFLNGQSQDWWGCVPPETPQTIVGRYIAQVVSPAAARPIGRGAAAAYAATNRGVLQRYSQHLHPMGADGVHATLVDGVVVPPIHVNVGASANVRGTLAPHIYGVEGQPVQSNATAEVYLDRVRTWETPCPANPQVVARHYQFRWRIRLVETGW